MSEAMENTASACDKLLDYVYGELTGDELEQFKLHLLTCEKCKRELQGLERVRSAVKSALPAVEPPVDKMAQLMHAAAQQKPKRGKVLMFARRVISHPAYAAAAVFVIVGGAVVVNFSAGRVSMPAPEKVVHEEVEVTKTPAAPAAQPAPVNPMMPVEEKPEATKGDKPIQEFAKDEAPKEKARESKIILKTDPAGAYTVRAAAPAAKKAEAKPQGDGLLGTLDDAKSTGGLGNGFGGGNTGKGHASSGAPSRHTVLEKESSVSGNYRAPGNVAPTTPQPPPPPAKPAATLDRERDARGGEGRVAQNEIPVAPNQVVQNQTNQVVQNQANQRRPDNTVSTPTTANAPAPEPAAAPALASESRVQTKSSIGNDNYKQQKNALDAATLKKKAQELAQSGRCDEADVLIKQIEHDYPNYLSSKEKAEFTRCRVIRDNNQQQMANEEQSNKANATRAKKAAPSKAKPAAPPADKSAY